MKPTTILVVSAMMMLISCGGDHSPKLVIETTDGDRYSGPLIEDLRVATSIQSEPIILTLDDIKDIESNDQRGSITVVTQDDNIIRGVIVGGYVKIVVAGNDINVSVGRINKLSIE